MNVWEMWKDTNAMRYAWKKREAQYVHMFDFWTLKRSKQDTRYSHASGRDATDMTALLMVVSTHARCLTVVQRGVERWKAMTRTTRATWNGVERVKVNDCREGSAIMMVGRGGQPQGTLPY